MDSRMWSDMFNLGLPVLEKILRPCIIYAVVIVGLRLAGKRELAQLNPFDLVVLLTISNTVQNAIIGDDTSVTGGIIGAATLLALNHVVVRFLFGHRRLGELVEGKPDVLIEGGRLRPQALKGEVISLEDLEAAAHKQGFASLDEVERAVIEPGGGISFFRKEMEPDAARHQQLLARLDEISRELASLRVASGTPRLSQD